MELVPFAEPAERLLRRCDEVGVVCEFFQAAPNPHDGRGKRAHALAAIAAVAEQCRRYAEMVAAHVPTSTADERAQLERTAAGWATAATAAARMAPDAIRGTPLSVDEFFGPESGRRVADVVEWAEPLDFFRAFFDPPYGVQLPRPDLDELFDGVVREVLRTPGADTAIWSWSTNWSPYFDAGHEWWGSACWTLDVDDGPLIVVLASSTD